MDADPHGWLVSCASSIHHPFGEFVESSDSLKIRVHPWFKFFFKPYLNQSKILIRKSSIHHRLQCLASQSGITMHRWIATSTAVTIEASSQPVPR